MPGAALVGTHTVRAFAVILSDVDLAEPVGLLQVVGVARVRGRVLVGRLYLVATVWNA